MSVHSCPSNPCPICRPEIATKEAFVVPPAPDKTARAHVIAYFDLSAEDQLALDPNVPVSIDFDGKDVVLCVEARDAEHAKVLAEVRAENDALRAAMVLKTSDFPALKAQIDRLKGELAEARRLIDQCSRGTNAYPYCLGCGRLRGTEHGSWCPLFNLAAPSPAESTGHVRSNCDGCARQLPIERGIHKGPGDPWDVQMCTADRYKTPTPPDDIRDRLARMETQVADEARDTSRSWLDHEERIKALEACPVVAQQLRDIVHAAPPHDVLERWDGALAKMAEGPAAPQEQAGHAFKPGALSVPLCAFQTGRRTICGRFKDDPIHTGAKP